MGVYRSKREALAPSVKGGCVPGVAGESAGLSQVRTPAGPNRARGMGWGLHGLMWCMVLTLLLIALPRSVFQGLLPGEVAGAKVVDSGTPSQTVQLQALREQIAQLQLAVAGSAKLPGQPMANRQADPLRPVVDIAKMTLDASKDKYDSIKDTYDKLFSLLVAMAALLTFFGFKGMDSFVAARRNAEEAVQQAEQARARADLAASQLKTFLEEDYGRDNRAEINVAQAISLREIALLYEKSWQLVRPDEAFPEHGREARRQYLSKANYYLKEALRHKDQLDKVLLLRALGVQCNTYRMLNDFDAALRTAQEIIERFPGEDESAYYNAACYCCLISEREQASHSLAENLLIDALRYLRTAIELYPQNAAEAQEEPDFNWLRANRKQEFERLLT